jgi:hypothetical protein
LPGRLKRPSYVLENEIHFPFVLITCLVQLLRESRFEPGG